MDLLKNLRGPIHFEDILGRPHIPQIHALGMRISLSSWGIRAMATQVVYPQRVCFSLDLRNLPSTKLLDLRRKTDRQQEHSLHHCDLVQSLGN